MSVYDKVINHYGKTAQLEKTMEELKELRLEIRRELDGHGNREAILNEMADVCNMLAQLNIIFSISQAELDEVKDFKMERTLNRIRKAKEG